MPRFISRPINVVGACIFYADFLCAARLSCAVDEARLFSLLIIVEDLTLIYCYFRCRSFHLVVYVLICSRDSHAHLSCWKGHFRRALVVKMITRNDIFAIIGGHSYLCFGSKLL